MLKDPAVDPGERDEQEAFMDEQNYMHAHARAYARAQGQGDPDEYADWYVEQFAEGRIENSPSHRTVFWTFLETVGA
jgi:hypothetical protein